MKKTLFQYGAVGSEDRAAFPDFDVAQALASQGDGGDPAKGGGDALNAVAGLLLDHQRILTCDELRELFQTRRILDLAPVGVMLLTEEGRVVWANQQAQRWIGDLATCTGAKFLELLPEPAFVGANFTPFETALATGRMTTAALRTGDNRWFSLQAVPAPLDQAPGQRLIAVLQDVSKEAHERQKLESLFRASASLLDLMPQEVAEMSHEDRVDLLRSNIEHYTRDILNYNVIEVRLLDPCSKKLLPLLSIGLDDAASCRELTASREENGVTGYVAATGVSYLCADTHEDTLYLQGFEGARSSLTVPLKTHDQVIGTFNVESPERNAFKHSDLAFVEIFSRSIAAALNTLDLLKAQSSNTAQESFEAIHRAVALPIDDILNTISLLMERLRVADPSATSSELCDALIPYVRAMHGKAREVRRIIHETGEKMAPVPATLAEPAASALRDHRVLVVDEDVEVRNDAHRLLEAYGCVVDTTVSGEMALCMVKNSQPTESYDAILCAIHLCDMQGHEVYERLTGMFDTVPMILMKGYGYDPHHNIPKAVQAGLDRESCIAKPLTEPQLVNTLERVLAKAAS